MMKRVITVICAISIIFTMMFVLAIPVSAGARQNTGDVKVSLSADKSTARPDETVTISIKLNATHAVMSGEVVVTYDSSKLTYVSGSAALSGKPATDLDVATTGSSVKLVYFDNTGGTNAFAKSSTMATLKFKVKKVDPGSAVFSASASAFGNVINNAAGGFEKQTASGMTLNIAAPLSTNNTLETMTVANAAISPAFNKGTTTYTAKVPFETKNLEVTAAAEDSGAKVSISGDKNLKVGTNNVTVVVTAASGAKKTYTIKVTKEQDPNYVYVPSAVNEISSIKLEGAVLSPAFSKNVKEYVVWLPYETESIKTDAIKVDSKSTVEIVGGKDLEAGFDKVNEIKVVCTSESGVVNEYVIKAMRAPAHGEEVVLLPVDTTPPETDEAPETSEAPPSDNTSPTAAVPVTPVDDETSCGMSVPLAIILIIIAIAAGFCGGYFFKSKKA